MANPHKGARLAKALAKAWRTILAPWVQDNIGASQTAVALKVAAAANTGTSMAQMRAGSVVGIGASFTVAPAGSALTLAVTKNGSVISGCTLSVAPGATLGRSTTFATGAYTFAAGDVLGVAITTDGSWTATTSDVVVAVEVETN